jgi:branched-chain amino acid transport system substrate-binding protein
MRYAGLVVGCLATALAGLGAGGAPAQSPAPDTTVKIGLVLPMTGARSAAGRDASDGAHLYMAQHGDTVAGRKIELIVKDDGGVAETAKRLAQDLIDNDKVNFFGAGLTAGALAMAPIATAARIPTVVMIAAASAVTASSPYYVRTSVTFGQQSGTIGDWAIKKGSKTAVMVLSDGPPGAEAGKAFALNFAAGGGRIVDTLKVPLADPDFSPPLQRVQDVKPDTLFIAVPAAQAKTFAQQFAKRELDKAGVKLVGPGEIADDDVLAGGGDTLLGVATAGCYSAAHPSQFNKDFVAAYRKATDRRANVISVGGYDGMHLIYAALEKTNGNTDGDAVIGAMKGMAWESPRGPIAIDPQTRDIVQNIYIRTIEMVAGESWAIEIKTFPAVKDPIEAPAK